MPIKWLLSHFNSKFLGMRVMPLNWSLSLNSNIGEEMEPPSSI